MSTNTKKKHGTGAAVVLIVLCLLALGALGYIIWRQFNPVVPETAAGYVAAAGTTAPVYDENGTQLGSLVRGAEVQYVAEDAEDGADRVRVVNGEGYVLLDASHLADDLSRTVQVETVYALRGMSLTDETGAVPGCAVEKGMALTVTGFDGLDENGEVVLGDEMITPDCSRFWPLEGYKVGQGQPSYDKQFVRDWLSANPDAGYELPQDVIDKTIGKYIEAYELLTGQKFDF